MFLVELQSMARAAGYRPVSVRPGASQIAGQLLVVDMAFKGDWEGEIRAAVRAGVPAVAFGPHVETEARRRAKEAGAARVLANSNLRRALPGILVEARAKTGLTAAAGEDENEAD
jgi:hypothetical protein